MAETVLTMSMPESSRSPTSPSAAGIERRRCHSQSRSPSALAVAMARSCRSREVMVSRSSRAITVQPYPAVVATTQHGLASRPALTAKRHEPVWQPNRRLKVGATASDRYLRLRRQRSDLVCGQPGGRRGEPKPDHPDRLRDPEGPFQQLDREVTVVSLRNPEGRPSSVR